MSLVIIRGLPGSGKSTKAKELIDKGFVNDWFETDTFFIGLDGSYNFDAGKLKEAHEWCQQSVKSSLKKGRSVVVSNTFTRIWEMEPYLEMAKSLNADVIVIECTGKYENIHGVPKEAIERMSERWETLNEPTFGMFHLQGKALVYLEDALGIPIISVRKHIA